MAKVKKTRLTHMVYDEVSSVDAGANQDAHVVLMKRDGGKKVSKKKLVLKAAPVVEEEVEIVEVEAPATSPAGSKLVKQEAGVAIYEDGSKFDGETWHDVPAGERTDEELAADHESVDAGTGEVVEGDDDEEVEPAEMSKADHNGVELDVLRLSAEFAQNISKAFAPDVPLADRAAKYEQAILGFNTAMDDAANGHWLVGTGITKSDDSEAVSKNVARIAEIFEHATTAAGGEIVTKNDDSTDIYKGLTPQAAEIVRKSAEVLEANEVSKFEGIAKSFTNVPADATKLGAALRKSHDTDPEGYATLTAALSAANEGLSNSEVFKSLGVAGGGETGEYADIEKAATAAVEAGTYATKEQAEVALMQANPGKFYKSTN